MWEVLFNSRNIDFETILPGRNNYILISNFPTNTHTYAD